MKIWLINIEKDIVLHTAYLNDVYFATVVNILRNGVDEIQLLNIINNLCKARKDIEIKLFNTIL